MFNQKKWYSLLFYHSIYSNARNEELDLKYTLSTQCLWCWVFHAKCVFFLNIFSGDLLFMSCTL